MSGSRVSFKLSEFTKSLPEDEFKFYWEKIRDKQRLDSDRGSQGAEINRDWTQVGGARETQWTTVAVYGGVQN